MTMGEGGCVYTDNPDLHRLILSFRDWGRDCVCPSGRDNYCGHRFDRQFGDLPPGYDHKYVYSHIGYNLKVTEMQAAIGCEQLKKLPGFIERRRHNWHRLRETLSVAEDKLILPEPAPGSSPRGLDFSFPSVQIADLIATASPPVLRRTIYRPVCYSAVTSSDIPALILSGVRTHTGWSGIWSGQTLL